MPQLDADHCNRADGDLDQTVTSDQGKTWEADSTNMEIDTNAVKKPARLSAGLMSI